MKRKTIKHRDERGLTEYVMYTKEEADKIGLPYVYWHDATPGGWIISDDNMVTTALSVKPYVDNNKKYQNFLVKTAFGMCYFKPERKSGDLNLANNEVNYTITGKRQLGGKRKEKCRMIALNYALTNDLEYSINKVSVTYPSMKKYNWRSWTRTEGFKDMVREELTKILADKGFTEADTINLLEETINMAKGKNDTKSLVTLVQTLLKMHGIDQPAKVKVTKELEATAVDLLYDEVTKREHEIEYRGSIVEESETHDGKE